MTDRDSAAASTPEPDAVPREPSKHELDEAMSGRGASAAQRAADPHDSGSTDLPDVDRPEADDDLTWSGGPDDEATTSTRRAPSRAAVISGGILAALLLALAILAATQDPKSYMPEINKQQIAGVAQVLEEEDIAEYTDDQVTAAQEAYAGAGAERDMTHETVAEALNSAKPDSVTATQVEDLLVEKKASYQTTEGLEKSLRSQIILFAVTGGLMALGTVFYQRGKPWARFIGMFVAGFIAVMYVMQVVQGALNIPGLAITFASVAAFYFFMKGRLEDPPVGARGGGFGGLGSLFQPRGPRAPKATE